MTGPYSILADVYSRSGQNKRVLTTPGRSVQFFGGHATITNHLDMPYMLEMENVRVNPRHQAMAWAPDWLRKIKQIKADVGWPDGWHVDFVNQDEFLVYYDDVPVEMPVASYLGRTTVTEPEETVDLTSRSWINPESLLEDPAEEEPSRPPVKARRR